jgi:hypothetical protein
MSYLYPNRKGKKNINHTQKLDVDHNGIKQFNHIQG